jgi:hypothetical protein
VEVVNGAGDATRNPLIEKTYAREDSNLHGVAPTRT